MSHEGMPYSYNKAVLDHPDMREFIEKVWDASCRKDARIAELEAALRPFGSVRFVKDIPLTKECDNATVFSASPQYLPSYPPPRDDEVRIMATLARIEAKLDQLLATKEDGPWATKS